MTNNPSIMDDWNTIKLHMEALAIENQNLRRQEDEIKDHVDQILVKMHLEKYIDQGIIFALQNILERVER